MPKKDEPAKHKARKIHARELIVDDRQASSFAGLSLIEKFASHLSVWTYAGKKLSERRGIYGRLDLVKAAVAGFLGGSRGSLLVGGVRQDDALLRDMGIGRLPGEKVFCEDLKRFGSDGVLDAMHRIISYTARKVLKRIEPGDIQVNHGFIPLFGDGSLHGDGPTLGRMGQERLRYVIGANKPAEVKERLQDLPEEGWAEVPEKHRTKGCVEEQTCTAHVQCESREGKRMVFGKRFRRDGDLVWKLYSLKMGMEDRLKDLLLDLAGHKPPCHELEKNCGCHALLTLSHNLARGIDLVCGIGARHRGQSFDISASKKP